MTAPNRINLTLLTGRREPVCKLNSMLSSSLRQDVGLDNHSKTDWAELLICPRRYILSFLLSMLYISGVEQPVWNSSYLGLYKSFNLQAIYIACPCACHLVESFCDFNGGRGWRLGENICNTGIHWLLLRYQEPSNIPSVLYRKAEVNS